MQRELKITADGSHTISVPELDVTYHSHHGAIAESIWVYLDAGFNYLRNTPHQQPITILEMGFGTGLNALLTWKEARLQQRPVHYIAIEKYPLTAKEYSALNHGHLLGMDEQLQQLHRSPWEQALTLDPYFTLHKKNISITDLSLDEPVNCIYFDAFAPTDQPELWTQAVFENLYRSLLPGGILVTYSSKSIVRKAMQAAGFTVTKITGPFGKRDMVRAIK